MEAKGGVGAHRPRSGPSVTWLSSVLLFASAAGIIITTVKGCRGADVLAVSILQRKPALEALSMSPNLLNLRLVHDFNLSTQETKAGGAMCMLEDACSTH